MKTVTCPACGAIGRIPADCEITMCAFGQHQVELETWEETRQDVAMARNEAEFEAALKGEAK